MKKTIAIVLSAAFLFLPELILQVQALPRFSARYRQNCNLCHTNPTGGGLRSLYASQFLVPNEIAADDFRIAETEGVGPQLNEYVTIGADLRMLHQYSDEPSNVANFFQMQGDIYVNFQMNPRLSLYFDHGSSQALELFGLAYWLPYKGYVKVGRFLPAYGWKLDDHTSFVREYLGFFPPNHTDTGIEFGVYPKRLSIQASVMNGNPGSPIDNNSKVSALLRAAVRFQVAGVGAAAGVSGRHNPLDGRDRNTAGVFGYLNWKAFTYVGQFDWDRDDPDIGVHTTAEVSTHELSCRIRRGVELKATYDFYDPDRNLLTGSVNRYGGGVFYLPNPFVSIEAYVRSYDVTEGPAVTKIDHLESILMFHVLF